MEKFKYKIEIGTSGVNYEDQKEFRMTIELTAKQFLELAQKFLDFRDSVKTTLPVVGE